MTINVPGLARLGLWAGLAVLGLNDSAARAQSIYTPAAAARHAQASQDVMDLSRAWRAVLQYDHTYQAAISEQAAAQTERAQGRAGLLPQIQAGYVRSNVSGSASQPNFAGQRVGRELDYKSTNGYIQLQQPLLNYSRYAEYQRGKARADQGSAVFDVRRQETGIRLATTYFNTLLAYETLALNRSLGESLEGQVAGFDARYQQNEGTRTDAQETRARLAVAKADIIEAEDRLVVATRELQALLGSPPKHLAALGSNFPLPPLNPGSLNEWLDRARANNAEIQSARQAVNVAEAEVDRAASRYLPTMDLVATYGKADSENLSTLSQRTNTFTIGIQVNIPIFTGGYNTANVSRTRSDRSRLQYELNAAIERSQAEVTRQYTNVQGGAQRVIALEAAVESGQLSLDSARKGFEVGAWSNLDVLKAQDKLYQAKYELVKARLEYLLARLQLSAAAGDLHSGPFDEINDLYLGPVIALSRNNNQ
ncbi:TolC family outer membrane protein [Candidimonas sp. SYP-B2681]|uniref:TolC family outer membrane protein n=1 Tax=Candidimonas sp. SYP-B2681 TaxID=2497686 RepID=UPI0013156522|nr:TolC family outer membrane protein [Candidimonas sp. SYP-B2681]